MALEIEIDGKQYKTGTLDAFKQSHIVRRLAPVIGAMAPAMQAFKVDPMQAFKLIAEALAKLSDEDVEYVQKSCLSVVHRKQGEGQWAKVYVPGGIIAFDDIKLLEMNELVFAVLRDNLSDFFSGLARRGWASPTSK